MIKYSYIVESDEANRIDGNIKRYGGPDAADAMAAWTAAIERGDEYVMLEALRMDQQSDG